MDQKAPREPSPAVETTEPVEGTEPAEESATADGSPGRFRARRTARLDGRSEVSILVASALVLLVALSSFTLLAYRSSVELLLDQRREEAEAWARALRSRFERQGLPADREVARLLPIEGWVAVLDASGQPVVSSNTTWLDDPNGLVTVAGYAAFSRRGETYRVRVDLPARLLRARQRSLAILTPVVLVVNVGVIVLLMIYVQRLLAPMDRFLDSARRLRGDDQGEDEVAFLARTFERALESLAEHPRASPGPTGGESDLGALEGALAESMESGVLLCDRSGAVVTINAVALQILELDGFVPGSPVAEVLAPFPSLRAIVTRAVENQAVVRREKCEIETSRGPRHLGSTAHPLRRDAGEIRGYLVLFADLTEIERELADERLSNSFRQIGELTAGVAHEMRNGMATLKGYLSLIERTESPRAVEDYLGELRAETDHLYRVLEDFLAFARPGSARLEEVSLPSLVHRVAGDPAFEPGSVEVQIDPSVSDGGSIEGDPMLLGKALYNLVHNAWSAQQQAADRPPSNTPDSGPPAVLVRLRATHGGHEIEVLDRGPGLPPELAAKLFEPFVSGRPGGVGLGLSLARRIVHMHRGTLSIENREGGGARARLRLDGGKIVT